MSRRRRRSCHRRASHRGSRSSTRWSLDQALSVTAAARGRAGCSRRGPATAGRVGRVLWKSGEILYGLRHTSDIFVSLSIFVYSLSIFVSWVLWFLKMRHATCHWQCFAIQRGTPLGTLRPRHRPVPRLATARRSTQTGHKSQNSKGDAHVLVKV